MGKRYYWLKLKEDFFNQKEIKRLRRVAGGDTYTIIYLKMLLLSLKTDGKIYFDGIGDDFIDELSLEIDEEIDNVRTTIAFLENKGLIQMVAIDEYYLPNIASMIGSETDSARRKRREREKLKKMEEEQEKLLDYYDDVSTKSQKSVTTSQSSHTEKELEKELEIELETDRETDPKRERKHNKNPFTFYEQNFGVISPFIADNISKWCDDLNDDLVIEAMKITVKRQKKFSYTEGILNYWYNHNISSLRDVEADRKDFERNNKKGSALKREIGESDY